jgi:hypothetical protein
VSPARVLHRNNPAHHRTVLNAVERASRSASGRALASDVREANKSLNNYRAEIAGPESP